MRRFLLAVALGLAAAGAAEAAPLVLNYSGTFGPTTTLDGVAFGVDTPFTFSAAFDSTTDSSPDPNYGVFAAIVTFQIEGHGTFTSLPSPDVNVYLYSGAVGFAAGLSDATGIAGFTTGFAGFFTTATPAFNADLPTGSVLSGLISPLSILPYTIPFGGGVGVLAINDLTALGTTATVAAVPEFSTLALAGLGGLGLVGIARGRRRA
jgi:hypothetical protein